MGLFSSLFGQKRELTLAGLKQRAKVGAKITLLTTRMHGSDMHLPDVLEGLTRIVRVVRSDCVQFDVYEPAGEHRSFLYWPEDSNEGFSGLINGPHGRFKGFMDENIFVFENSAAWYVYRIDD